MLIIFKNTVCVTQNLYEHIVVNDMFQYWCAVEQEALKECNGKYDQYRYTRVCVCVHNSIGLT